MLSSQQHTISLSLLSLGAALVVALLAAGVVAGPPPPRSYYAKYGQERAAYYEAQKAAGRSTATGDAAAP